MRRQKRDRLERAYHKGYLAGLQGKSRDACPKDTGEIHQEWINGWREGRVDMWNGYSGVSGLHKIAHVTMGPA